MRVSACVRPAVSRTVLVISGDLDAASSGVFQESLLRAARSHGSPLLLDLSGIDFVDCAGLTALITIRRLIEARDCGLQIIAASRALRAIVGLTGTQFVLDEIPRTLAIRGDRTHPLNRTASLALPIPHHEEQVNAPRRGPRMPRAAKSMRACE